MMQPIPTHLGPFYLAVSATMNAAGELEYRTLRMDHPGDRLVQEGAGLAAPGCGHLPCRIANLGAAAVDWAYLLQLDSGIQEFHPEQMGFNVAPE